jgi:hypothetical protein
MSQFDFGTIDPYVVNGVQLASDLNQWRDAIYSMHRGATRPSYAVVGQMWINDSGGATNWVVNVYFGATVGDKPIWTYDTTTGVIRPVSGIAPTNVLQLYSESVLASSATEIRVNVPPNAKRIDIEYHFANSVAADFSALMQGLAGSTPVTSTVYASQWVLGAGSTAQASGSGGLTGWTMGTAQGFSGRTRLVNMGTNLWYGTMEGYAIQAAGTRVAILVANDMNNAGTTGFRFTSTTGAINFLAGNFARVFAAY